MAKYNKIVRNKKNHMTSSLIIQSVIVILGSVTLLTINKFNWLVPARYLNSIKKSRNIVRFTPEFIGVATH